MTTTRRMLATLALVLPGVLAVGCSDDEEAAVDDTVAETDQTRLETTGGTSDPTAYCIMSSDLGAAGGTPSEAELAELANIAPPEIRDAVLTVSDAIVGDEGLTPEVEQAQDDIEAWEAENCDREEAEAPDDNEQPGQVGGVEPPGTEGGAETEAGE